MFFLFVNILSSKSYTLTINLSGYDINEIVLLAYHGSETTIVDRSDVVNSKVVFFTDNLSTGLYKVKINAKNSFDVILNNEDVVVNYDLNSPDSIEFINSNENVLYLNNIKSSIKYTEKLNIINALLFEYPIEDVFFQKVKVDFIQLQKKYVQEEMKIINDNSNTYFARLSKADTKLIVPFYSNKDSTINYLKNKYFQSISISDTMLLNSNIISIKIRDYFNLMTNGLVGDLYEEKLIEAVDCFMKQVIRSHISIRKHIVEEVNYIYQNTRNTKFYSYFAKTYLSRYVSEAERISTKKYYNKSFK